MDAMSQMMMSMENVLVLPRIFRSKRPPPGSPSSSSATQNVALVGCDKSYQSDLARVDNLPVIDMWSPEKRTF